MLLDMTATHVPVLAGELSTSSTRSRARSRSTARSAPAATRAWSPSASGPAGTLIAIDRDPAAEERFAELAAEVAVPHALHPRAVRRGARASCATRACAPTSSTSTSACPRCRSTRASAASPTPTTRRWTCAWTPTQELDRRATSSTSGTSAAWRALLRDYGEERYARPIARAIVRAARAAPIETTNELVEVVTAAVPRPGALRRRPPGQARLPGASASRSTTSSASSTRALPLAWDAARATMADLQGSPSTRSRTAA